MASTEYSILSSNETDADKHGHSSKSVRGQRNWTGIALLLSIALVASVFMNLILIARWTRPAKKDELAVSEFGIPSHCALFNGY